MIPEAVELATIIANRGMFSDVIVGEAFARAAQTPVESLAHQAALTVAVARLASEQVARLLADPVALRALAAAAAAGSPSGPALVGVTVPALLRAAGDAAARLTTDR